jgi:hypothetical protein
VDALLELGYDSSMKDKLLKSTHTLDILCRASAPIRQTADVLREAGMAEWTVTVVWIEVGHMARAVLNAVCGVSSILHRFEVYIVWMGVGATEIPYDSFTVPSICSAFVITPGWLEISHI